MLSNLSMALFTATTNPMIITAAATVVSSRPYLAKRIEWIGAATVGNSCVIADLSSTPKTLAAGIAPVVNQAVTLWPGPTRLTLPGKSGQTASWQVQTIQSGTLLIWY